MVSSAWHTISRRNTQVLVHEEAGTSTPPYTHPGPPRYNYITYLPVWGGERKTKTLTCKKAEHVTSRAEQSRGTGTHGERREEKRRREKQMGWIRAWRERESQTIMDMVCHLHSCRCFWLHRSAGSDIHGFSYLATGLHLCVSASGPGKASVLT